MANTDIRAQQRYTGASDAKVNVSADVNKNMLVSQGLPPYAEMSRLGEGWTCQTSTLFAPLTAIPTTVAALEWRNNSSTLKRVALVRDLFASQVLSTAVVQTYSIYAMVTVVTTALPSLTALVQSSLSGRNTVTPTASGEIVTGVGTTVVANGWRPYGPPQAWGLAAATPGNSWSVPVDGKIIVPFGCSLCLHIVGSLATASSFQVGFTYDWVAGLVVEG